MSEPQAYYDTTGALPDDLQARIEQAETQEERAEEYFRARPDALLTPFEVKGAIFPDAPITSVRRALTNLTDRGVLEKTDVQRSGPYGRENHCWTFRREEGEQASIFDEPEPTR